MGIGGLVRQGEFHNAVAVEEQIGVDRLPVAILIIAGAIGLSQADRVLLIQASLVMSAVSTLLQLFPIGKRFGSGLPVILGVSFAYVPSMQAIASSGGGISAIAGAMVVGGIVAVIVGVFEQITATQEADTLRLYINGVLKAETTGASCDSVKAKVLMGRGMKGNLDEVRLWEKTLSSAQVERDFNRYLHGGEDGMLAYWRFNDGIDGEFYDLAHDSNDMYYMHDGVFVRDTQTSVIYDTKIPEKGQLAYKGVTDAWQNRTSKLPRE